MWRVQRVNAEGNDGVMMQSGGMVRVLAVSGNSNTGKTTLLEALVREMKKRGLKVFVVKHGRHFSWSGGNGSKDTERLWNSGAEVAFLSEGFTYIALRREFELEEFVELISEICGVDVILLEGFRKKKVRKIVILDEKSRVEDFEGEILMVLRKEDVLSGKVDAGKIVDRILRG